MEERYAEIFIYQTEDGLTNIDVKMQDETVWLTQQQLVELYQTSKGNISEHIKHVFEEGELLMAKTRENTYKFMIWDLGSFEK